MKSLCLFTIVICFISCHTKNDQQNIAAKDSVILNYKNIPTDRSSVDPNPVKTYKEEVKSFETTDQFIVSLYETRETFHYLIRIQYKNLEAGDTLNVPNFGTAPSVEILKGEKRPSCIVGFLDEDKKFRESKLICFEDNELKIHVLKHYGVATYRDTLK